MDQLYEKRKLGFMEKYVSIITFLLLFTISAQAQHLIQGTVKDDAGESLPGVSISVSGSNLISISDTDGRFSINVPSNESVLIFKYIGMEEQRITPGTSRSLTVTLKNKLSDLDEVVVIGYGTAKKSDLTGSVASIKGEDLERFPAGNVTEMLRGQAAGIQVTQNNAAPGGSSNVYIRGKRSLSSSQSPLYIVDGMIVANINDLNSSDIASIEVLKDASSQAIYGSRASNGVVLVTTKRGKSGEPTIDFSVYTGAQKFTRNFDVYSPEEWLTLRWWAKNNDGVGNIGTLDNMNIETVLDDAIMYEAYQQGKFTGWEDLLLKNGLQYKTDLSLRGGSEKIKYAVGAGYYNQDGIVDKSGYQRGNFRTNIDYSVYKWLDMGVNFSYARAKTLTSDGRFYDVLTRPMLGQPYDENGILKREIDGAGNINPLWRNRERDEEQLDEFLTFSPFLQFKIHEGLSYRFTANIRTNNRESGQYTTKLFPGSTGEGQMREFSRSSWLINNAINYQVPIANDNHKLSVTLIQESEQDLQKTTGLNFINSTSDLFKWNIAADSEVDNVVRSITRQRSTSFAGRLQYDLKNKYLLTASIRRDGVSVFGQDHKWSNFPSIALAWKINEESFFQNQTWIDLLKARLSYGVVGNWGIPAYRTLGLATAYEYLLADQLGVGYLPSEQLQNLDLQWERTGSLNAGLDLSAFKGRLSATVEYYNTNTTDLLVERTIPSNTGYSTMWDNLGKTKSWGWEGTVNGKVIESKDFSWDLGFSVSTQRNKILRIDGRTDDQGQPINDIPNNWFVGSPINVIYQYESGGIWQEGQTPDPSQYLPGSSVPRPGDIIIADYNGDGQVTVDDRKIHELDPQWYGTINTSFRYKGLDLGVEFYTVQDVIKNNILLYNSDRGGALNGKLNGVKVNYWTPENKSNEFPRPYYTASAPNFPILGLQDASYFRLRSATIGYSLPKSLLPKLKLSNARLYGTFTNVFTITDYRSYSPENQATEYPEPQTFVFGLNLSF